MKNYYSAGSRKWILLWVFTALWLVGTTLGTWSAVLYGASGPVGSSQVVSLFGRRGNVGRRRVPCLVC